MYQFIATYYNMDGLEDIKKIIEIDTMGVNLTERQVYIIAMERAYDKSREMGDAWGLGSIEFLSC